MHLKEGEIRAFYDDELDAAARRRVEAHLQACSRCQAQAAQTLADGQNVQAQMDLLATGELPSRHSMAAVRPRLEARRALLDKEQINMSNKWYNRVPRPVWAVIVVVAVLTVALSFAPVRAVANSFLGLFRVQQIQVIQVNQDALPQQLGSTSQFESMLSQDVKFTDQSKLQEVTDAAEASRVAGIPVRLPQAISSAPALVVSPAGNATLTVNVEHMRALLAEIGRSDIQIPDQLDGTQVSVQIPMGVQARYGDCKIAKPADSGPDMQSMPTMPRCTMLIQMPSPTISAPPGLDIQKIGEAYLQVMGMSQADAANFARSIDWTSTFVIPIPRYNTSYQQVAVDGVTGTLIQQSGGSRAGQFMLMWVKDGMIYALTGPGNSETALQLAASLN